MSIIGARHPKYRAGPRMSEKKRRLIRIKNFAAEASYFRLKGQIQTAMEFERGIEGVYAEARAAGDDEAPYEAAVMKGFDKAARRYRKENAAILKAARKKTRAALAPLKGD